MGELQPVRKIRKVNEVGPGGSCYDALMNFDVVSFRKKLFMCGSLLVFMVITSGLGG